MQSYFTWRMDMHSYDPVSKIIKADLNAEVDAWLAEGNQIKVLPSYVYQPRHGCPFNRDEQDATRTQINRLNNWLAAKAGRVALLGQHTGIGNTYLSNIRRFLKPCKSGLYEKFESAMKAIEKDGK